MMARSGSPRRLAVCMALLVATLAAPGWAEEPKAPASSAGTGGAKKPASKSGSKSAQAGSAAPGRSARAGTPPATVNDAGKEAAPSGATGSGATETVALEIVAKAPKPIPPVELDMLQLRLMLTDLKASFTDEIDKALFREPF